MFSTKASPAEEKKSSIVVSKNTKSSFSSISYPSDNKSFFALKSIPTLKRLASIELVNQLGSVESVEAYLKESRVDKYLHNDMFIVLDKIKKLHQFVIANKVEEVDEFLKTAPDYLLPVLLKTISIRVTSAKGLRNHIAVEGTALMMALGAEATGRNGCDLCLMPPNSRLKNSTFKKLALYSDDNPHTPLRYFINGQEWTIECGDQEDQLSRQHFDNLKKMFNNPDLHNKNLNLNNPALNEVQRDAYAALLKITEKRGHTLFVNEDGMVETLQHHIKRMLPNNHEGEAEITKQRSAQFPKGCEEKEEKQYAEDLRALRRIRRSIATSTSDHDPKLIFALQEFRKYFEPKAKEIIRTGRYGKTKLLLTALELVNNEHFSDGRKDDLYCNKVVGWLQRLAQENIKQEMEQSLDSLFELGKKSNRSLNSTLGDDVRYKLPETGIGIDSWIEPNSGKIIWGAPLTWNSLYISMYKQYRTASLPLSSYASPDFSRHPIGVSQKRF